MSRVMRLAFLVLSAAPGKEPELVSALHLAGLYFSAVARPPVPQTGDSLLDRGHRTAVLSLLAGPT